MPLAPNAWQARAREVFELWLDAEMSLLRAVKRRLAKGIDRPGWAERKYAEARAMRIEAESILAALSKDTAQIYVNRIAGTYGSGAEAAYADLRKGMDVPRLIMPAARIQRIDAILDALQGKVRAQYGRILREVDDQYRRIIGYGVADLATGSITLRQSVQRSLDAFAAAGIASFTDSKERDWGMPEYAEMATRTGMMHAALAGYTDAALANGQDLVITTDHSDECPLCTPWEDKVLTLTGAMRNHPDCQGTMAEATAAGLFHPGCLHSFSVYIPGMTRRGGGDPQTPEQNVRGYKNRQQMRYMERQVRSWKRRQTVAIEPIEERRCKAYVDKWQAKLRDLTQSTGLMRGNGREGPRVLLSPAAKWGERGTLYRKSDNSGAFASLPERMSKKHIRELAREQGLSLKGLTLLIDYDEDKLKPSFPFAGRADTATVGRIDFFPRAFSSREELTRTLIHEKIHVEQFRRYGVEYVQNHRAYFERLAEEVEHAFIVRAKELKRL